MTATHLAYTPNEMIEINTADGPMLFQKSLIIAISGNEACLLHLDYSRTDKRYQYTKMSYQEVKELLYE